MGRLIAPLDEHEMHRQIDRIMSPLVWDVGHAGNFEELWLLRQLDGRPAHDPALDSVYNPFEDEYQVLRGASWATSSRVGRGTFRNWDHPKRRQLFAGLRLVWEVR